MAKQRRQRRAETWKTMKMDMKPIAEIATREEARDIAVQWQHWQAEQSMSMGELLEWQCYFEQLAEKFDLMDEFKENAIC